MNNPKELDQWFLRYHKILSSKSHTPAKIEAKKFKKPKLLPIIKYKKNKKTKRSKTEIRRN